mmetsp:Transcript_22822/g.67126  ORF Transcript_22822/g.67126 Transcript_22822/m.67126 type:complete len:456 (-) Transcript_22822:145-1512(-)
MRVVHGLTTNDQHRLHLLTFSAVGRQLHHSWLVLVLVGQVHLDVDSEALEGKRAKPCELGGESGRESLLPLRLGERFRARARGESAERRPQEIVGRELVVKEVGRRERELRAEGLHESNKERGARLERSLAAAQERHEPLPLLERREAGEAEEEQEGQLQLAEQTRLARAQPVGRASRRPTRVRRRRVLVREQPAEPLGPVEQKRGQCAAASPADATAAVRAQRVRVHLDVSRRGGDRSCTATAPTSTLRAAFRCAATCCATCCAAPRPLPGSGGCGRRCQIGFSLDSFSLGAAAAAARRGGACPGREGLEVFGCRGTDERGRRDGGPGEGRGRDVLRERGPFSPSAQRVRAERRVEREARCGGSVRCCLGGRQRQQQLHRRIPPEHGYLGGSERDEAACAIHVGAKDEEVHALRRDHLHAAKAIPDGVRAQVDAKLPARGKAEAHQSAAPLREL